MKKIIALITTTLFLGCSAPDRTRETLEKGGFSDVEITGWEVWGCGEDDTFSTGFEATNSHDERVSGVVCCGLVAKSCTIRF